MNPIALAAPAVEPVSLAEMRAHLRLDGTDEDDLVAALAVSARMTVEAATRLALVSQGWRYTVPAPAGATIALPLAPVLTVDAVRQMAGGIVTALPPDGYRLSAEGDPSRLVLASASPGALQIDATYGFGPAAADVPAPLRLAIRQLAAAWFENRGDGPSLAPPALPPSVQALLAPFARRRLA